MKRVNWEAKSEFQYIENYKILQAAFTKRNVQKQVDVDRLIRAKYQDNLEFCQWLKAFFEHAAPPSREDYDPVSRRQLGKGGKHLDNIFLPRGMKKNGARPPISKRLSSAGSVTGGGGGGTVSSSSSSSSRARSSSRPSSAGSIVSSSRDHQRTDPLVSSRHSIIPKRNNDSVDADLLKKNNELKRRNAEIELTLDTIEKERDFYFDKLRGIEVMLQVHEEKGDESDPEELMQRIYKVLYAKLEDDIVVTDEGELLENDVEGLNNDSMISMEDLIE